MDRTPIRASLAACAAFLTLSLPATVRAADPELTLDAPLYEPGMSVTMRIEGTPGHVPLLLASTAPGPTTMPKIGVVGVGIPFVVMQIPPLPPSGVLEASCTLDCGTPFINLPIFMQVVMFDPQTSKFSGKSERVVLDVTTGECNVCAAAAPKDPVYGVLLGNHALLFPGLGGKFVFGASGQFVERADGTARLSGTVTDLDEPSRCLIVDIAFAGRVGPGDAGFPPAGSPHLDLTPAAYVQNGGPIDTGTWHYYATTAGTLVGCDVLEGAFLTIAGTGPAFQVGVGANGKNLAFGASGWLDVELVAQPTTGVILPVDPDDGDINIDVVECP